MSELQGEHRRGGGPNTPEGKEIASQNAITHGGRTRRPVVKGESQEEYDENARRWREEFDLEGHAAESLLEEVILEHWLLLRAKRNYLEVEARLADVAASEWTPEQHHQLSLFLRYKTSAERSFARAYNMLNGLRKDKLREETTMARVEELMKRTAERIMRETQEESVVNCCLEVVCPGPDGDVLVDRIWMKAPRFIKGRKTTRARRSAAGGSAFSGGHADEGEFADGDKAWSGGNGAG